MHRAEFTEARILNPAAGNYPVTADERELRAAVEAGERSWAEFPYYDARYGERGRRFGHSDGAWIALMAADLDQAGVNQEVLWLARLLSARGMPQLLMEHHLRFLHHALAAANPAKAKAYARLLGAAEMLASLRREKLSDEQLAALAAGFDRAVAGDSAHIPRMGEILVAAVVDEASEVDNAARKVETWAADPARFSPQWISAVAETLRRAREAVGLA